MNTFLAVSTVMVAASVCACTYGPRLVMMAPSATEASQDVPGGTLAAARPVIIQCADPLHQAFPGGSDYEGIPVPQCPPVNPEAWQ
jgi:hypothetical protein